MQLSPVTHHTLRQLLKQHTAGLNHELVEGARVDCPEHIDLNLLLKKLHPRRFDAVAKIRQLESLVTIYKQLTPKNSYDYESLAEVKRRIFQLLGLRLGITSSAILPTVLAEHSVVTFRFYLVGQVREGMRKQEKLYGLLKNVEGSQKLQLYQLAWALCEQGLHCILTLSESRYAVWVPLRSPVYKIFLNQGERSLDQILLLYSTISGLKSSINRKKGGASLVEPSTLYHPSSKQ